VTEYRQDSSPKSVKPEDVRAFFETAVSGTLKTRQVWKTTQVNTYSTASTVLFETEDLEANGAWIHKSFISRGQERMVVPLDRDVRENTPRR